MHDTIVYYDRIYACILILYPIGIAHITLELVAPVAVIVPAFPPPLPTVAANTLWMCRQVPAVNTLLVPFIVTYSVWIL